MQYANTLNRQSLTWLVRNRMEVLIHLESQVGWLLLVLGFPFFLLSLVCFVVLDTCLVVVVLEWVSLFINGAIYWVGVFSNAVWPALMCCFLVKGLRTKHDHQKGPTTSHQTPATTVQNINQTTSPEATTEGGKISTQLNSSYILNDTKNNNWYSSVSKEIDRVSYNHTTPYCE